MDPEAFVALLDRRLGDRLHDAAPVLIEDQAAVDFYHPETRERLLGPAGRGNPMHKSGIAFLAPTRTIKLTLRVPEPISEDIVEILDPPERADVTVTDKRAATTLEGEVVALVHCALRLDDVSRDELGPVGLARPGARRRVRRSCTELDRLPTTTPQVSVVRAAAGRSSPAGSAAVT